MDDFKNLPVSAKDYSITHVADLLGNLDNSPISKTPPLETFRIRRAKVILGVIALLMLSDFLARGILHSFEPAKTDFSELYSSAWLWRHGQNFYNSNIVTAAQLRLVGVSVRVAPIYPPTTFALLSPFTLLPWGWANLIWQTLGFFGIGATFFLLSCLHGSRAWDVSTMALATFLVSFDPLHQAFHLGNVVLVAVPAAFGAVLLAEKGRYWRAGFVIGIVFCLKPQIGAWLIPYYLFQRRWRVLFGGFVAGLSGATLLLLHPVVLRNSISDYRANLLYWFAPGRPYSFTEGALPFHVNVVQVLLYQWVHNVQVANLIAFALFAGGVTCWVLMLWRSALRISAPLAISSLLALSFLSLYHSVSDATILTLALCWAIPRNHESWTPTKIAACISLFLMALPGHSALMRFSARIPVSITTAWWWNLFVARYFVWLLLAFNIALLLGVWESARAVLAGSQDRSKSLSIAGGHPAIYQE